MQFSYSWLKTQADTELSADKLEHLLTMSGLEVKKPRLPRLRLRAW